MNRKLPIHPRRIVEQSIRRLRRIPHSISERLGLIGGHRHRLAADLWDLLFGPRLSNARSARRVRKHSRSWLAGVEALEYRRVLANTVSISLLQNGAESPGPINSVTFQVSQQTPVSGVTTVTFNLGGTATEGSDYQTTPHFVQIPANGTATTI